MQVGTLIQSLARNYIEYENDTSYSVGLDIWSQLTDYAKERIRMFFTAGDSAVEEFISILEDDSSDERVSRYYTEREMREEANLRSKEEQLSANDSCFSLPGFLAESHIYICSIANRNPENHGDHKEGSAIHPT